jgi:hypothetical protein
MPLIEMGKKYQTRDGRPVRILATDAGGECPVVALTIDSDGGATFRCEPNGLYYPAGGVMHHMDLIEAPVAHTRWINVYANNIRPPSDGHYYIRRADADRGAKPDRIACIPISFKEGDGL